MRPRVVPALVALILSAAACAPAASSPSPVPSPTLSPTLTAASTSSPTAVPSRTPASRTPSPVPSSAPSELVVRIDQFSDVCCPYTSLLVAVDGSYVIGAMQTADYFTARQLSPDGVRLVRERVASTGLFGADASLRLIPRPGPTPLPHGVGATSVSFWDGTRAVHVSMTAIVSGEESYYDVSPQQITLTKLVSDLRAPETWLPASAWQNATALPYSAKRYRIIHGAGLSSGPGAPFDLERVGWPFATPLGTFGDIVAPPGETHIVHGTVLNGPIRCATVTREDALAIRDALMTAWAPINTSQDRFSVDGTIGGAGVVLLAVPLLPVYGTCTEEFWW